ncbi:MAG: hypothetical protein OHK0017_06210 [Patescibacteria group bacterium]
MNFLLVNNNFIEETKLALDFGAQMLNASPNLNPDWHSFKYDLENQHPQLDYLLNTGRLIVFPIQSKGDLKTDEDISQYFLPYFVKQKEPTFIYLGSLSNFSQSMQESLLRFLEEPPQNLHLILSARTKNDILSTILSRCQTEFVPPRISQKYMLRDDLKKMVEAFPEARQFALDMVKGLDRLPEIDFKKTSREGISVWLWQLEFTLSQMFWKHPGNKNIQEALQKVIQAQKLNQANVLNRLVLAQLIV